MSGRKGSLASRSLEYRAPEVPNFLKALKAQVASSERYFSSASSSRHTDELDSLVTSTSASGKRKARDDEEGDGLDSEDEMNGAQVVVLKDGKHLSHDEALRIKRTQIHSEPSSAATEKPAAGRNQNIAGSGSAVSAKKRRDPIGDAVEPKADVSISSLLDRSTEAKANSQSKDAGKGALDDVKQLIRQDRESRAPPTASKEAREKTKDQRRKEKNAQARKLKAKSGKGLSFDLDD